LAGPPDRVAVSRQTLTQKSPRPTDGEAKVAAQVLSQAVSQSLRGMEGLSSAQLADYVDTGVRMTESAGSDQVLLEMPRGSPAEICVRISPGDRVLGLSLSVLSLPCLPLRCTCCTLRLCVWLCVWPLRGMLNSVQG
jgi:hypothetical protein